MNNTQSKKEISLVDTSMNICINYLINDITKVSLQRFIAGIIAELIFKYDWEDIKNDNSNISNYIKKLTECNKRRITTLKSYNRESLYMYIENILDIESCIVLLPKGTRCWAYEFDEINHIISLDAFLKWKNDFEIKYNRPYNAPELPTCGCNTYINEKGAEKEPRNVQRKVTKNNPNKEQTESIKRDIIRLYDNLVCTRGGDNVVDNFEYIWEWKISEQEYNEIIETLLKEECKKYINKLIFDNRKILFIVVAYVAERFKREWNANDGNDNALRLLGLGNNSKEIAEEYFNKTQERIFKHSQSNEGEWLESLRMEGGLPIKRINSSDSGLSKFAEKLWHDPNSAIEYLKIKIKNQTLKYSYNNNLSVYKFVNTLKSSIDNLSNIFHEDDINSELVTKFAEMLKEGRSKVRETSKFDLKYNVWKFYHEFVIYRKVVLKSAGEYDEPKELISISRIKEQWEIENPTYVFKLEIGGEKYLFTQWKFEGEDYYRSTTGLTEFALQPIKGPNYHLPKEDIYYIPIDENGKEGEKIRIRCSFNHKKNFFNFSSNNKLNWDSGSRKYFSAVLLTKKYKIEGCIKEDIEFGNNFRWIEYFDYLKVDDTYIYADKFTVFPQDNAVHTIKKHNFIRKIEYCKGEERKEVFILSSEKIEANNFVKRDNYGNIINVERIGNVDNSQTQGYTRLKMDGISFDAFILPETIRIRRNVKSGNIIIDGCDFSVIDNWVQRGGNTIYDKYNDDNKQKEVINIKLFLNKETEDCLSLEIVRPLDCKNKILGSYILSIEESIPKKFGSKYKIRIFDENGVRYTDDYSTKKKYSDEIQKYKKQFYYITQLKEEKNLEFIYITIDGNKQLQEETLSIKSRTLIEQNNNEYKVIKNVEQSDTGVIIQSLQNKSTELTYYEPTYIGGIKEILKNIPAIDRLEMTIKHQLYYDVLHFKEEFTPQFFIDYCNYCEAKKKNINWSFLWDIAEYFGIDWILIGRKAWRNVAKRSEVKKRDLIRTLFMHSPNANYLEYLIEHFWEFRTTQHRGRMTFLEKLLNEDDFNNTVWREDFSNIEEEAKRLELKRLTNKRTII